MTIGLSEIGLVVEFIDLDLKGAIRGAAEACAVRLRELGYAVTAADVTGALDVALAGSEVVRRHTKHWLN